MEVEISQRSSGIWSVAKIYSACALVANGQGSAFIG